LGFRRPNRKPGRGDGSFPLRLKQRLLEPLAHYPALLRKRRPWAPGSRRWPL